MVVLPYRPQSFRQDREAKNSKHLRRDRLQLFGRYLQQLVMESLGKAPVPENQPGGSHFAVFPADRQGTCKATW